MRPGAFSQGGYRAIDSSEFTHGVESTPFSSSAPRPADRYAARPMRAFLSLLMLCLSCATAKPAPAPTETTAVAPVAEKDDLASAFDSPAEVAARAPTLPDDSAGKFRTALQDTRDLLDSKHAPEALARAEAHRAINRLRESTRKSKVIILMTDGVNNAGMVQPLDAAQIAHQLGIRVYTIGVGTRGQALSPYALGFNGQYQYRMMDVEIDDDMLRQVADMTGGKYFRATDEKKLKAVYDEIDKLEKTREKITRYSRRSDKYFNVLLAGCSLLALGLLLERTFLRTTP